MLEMEMLKGGSNHVKKIPYQHTNSSVNAVYLVIGLKWMQLNVLCGLLFLLFVCVL